MSQNLILFVLSILMSIRAFAQYSHVTVEKSAIHSNTDYADIEGFVTYQVFVHTMQDSDKILALYAHNGDLGQETVPLGITIESGSIYSGYNANLSYFSPVCFNLPSVPNSSFWVFGSFISIGNACASQAIGNFIEPSDFGFQFNSGSSAYLTEGTISANLNNFGGDAGFLKKVLIAQFTSNGDWEFCFSVSGLTLNESNEYVPFNEENICVHSSDYIWPERPFSLLPQKPVICPDSYSKVTFDYYIGVLNFQSPYFNPDYILADYDILKSETSDGEFEFVQTFDTFSDIKIYQAGYYRVRAYSDGYEYLSNVFEIMQAETCVTDNGINSYILQDAVVEVIAVHDGAEIPELEGFVTYRVYLETFNNDDFLSLLFGAPEHWMSDGPSLFGLNIPSGSLYNSPFSSGCTPDLNCNITEFIPAAAFDSYYTIGSTCGSIPNEMLFQVWSEQDNVCDSFAQGNPQPAYEGGFFTLQDFSNGFSGEDNRILIGQFTTDGDWEYCFSLQGQIHGTPGTPHVWAASSVCVNSADAVLPDMQLTLSYDMNLSCDSGISNIQVFHDNALIEAAIPVLKLSKLNEQSGMFEAFSVVEGTFLVSVSEPGIYKLTVETQLFNFLHEFEPFEVAGPSQPMLFYSFEPSTPCESTIYQLSVNDFDQTWTALLDGIVLFGESMIDDLDCGVHSIEVMDADGCTSIEVINLECFEPTSLDVQTQNESVQGLNDGLVAVLINSLFDGSLVSLTVTGSDFVESVIGISPMNYEISNMAPGMYMASALDAFGCLNEIEFEILEGNVSVQENLFNTAFRFFPNPFNDRINLDIASDCLIILTDVTGNEVFRRNFNPGIHSVNTGLLSSGVYFLKFMGKDFIQIDKMTKMGN